MPLSNRFLSGLRACLVAAVLLMVAGCTQAPPPTTSEPEITDEAPATDAPTSTATQAPTATEAPTDEPVFTVPEDSLAPAGVSGETYFAAFPVAIELDGDLSDWEKVPTVMMPPGGPVNPTGPGLTFAATADETYLYVMASVLDDNIISGQHDDVYWNEDSVEIYINGTGNQELSSYETGVVQMTLPPMNADLAPEEAIISGIDGTMAGAQVRTVITDTGYVIEVAVPLENDIWSITPVHGAQIGFQVHLNSASESARDGKLIWSKRDKSDTSYQNPSVFGSLVFFEVGQQVAAQATATPLPLPTATPVPIEADAVFMDADADIEDRVEDLLARMTLEEKIGQMTLVEKGSIKELDLIDMRIGGLLSGGGGFPIPNTPENWAAMVDNYQSIAMQTPLHIPLIYGVDAVHGHNNVAGAVIFPQNIGLGAANDPELMERIGRVTAEEMIATGIYWDYAPVVAVVQDIRWGRTYESYGENTELVTDLATAFIRGLQGDDLAAPGAVLATPKHYVGDGGTTYGSSTTGEYILDQGVTEVDEATLRAVHLPPYISALDEGALSVMASYSSWQDTKMHGQKYLMTDVLKGELGFSGFIVSDWAGIDQISPDDYYNAVVVSTNAGIDMNMVPYDYKRFIEALTTAVENGDVPMERIDDAVRRILRVKFAMGLFEHPFSNPDLLASVGSEEHRAVAREAVSKSLVLLKNENDALPLSKDEETILVAGSADNIGFQSGGWTINWQGGLGPITEGTTILQAIQNTVSDDTEVIYDPFGRLSKVPAGTNVGMCVAVVGETPYAEGIGDSIDLGFSEKDVAMLERLTARCDKLVVVLISGRPLIVTDMFDDWDALVAAWLPGTEGQGVADVLFGDEPFTGKLPFTWPRSVDQLPLGTVRSDQALFPYGYGLTE